MNVVGFGKNVYKGLFVCFENVNLVCCFVVILRYKVFVLN